MAKRRRRHNKKGLPLLSTKSKDWIRLNVEVTNVMYEQKACDQDDEEKRTELLQKQIDLLNQMDDLWETMTFSERNNIFRWGYFELTNPIRPKLSSRKGLEYREPAPLSHETQTSPDSLEETPPSDESISSHDGPDEHDPAQHD